MNTIEKVTIRPGDKSKQWCPPAPCDLLPDIETTIVVVHNDNLDEFLKEHSIEITGKQRDHAVRPRTDTIALFGPEGLDCVTLSPPDLDEVETVFESSPRTLPPEAITSLLASLYF